MSVRVYAAACLQQSHSDSPRQPPNHALGEAGDCLSPYRPHALSETRGEHHMHCQTLTWVLRPDSAVPERCRSQQPRLSSCVGTALLRHGLAAVKWQAYRRKPAPTPVCPTIPSLLRVGRVLLPPSTKHTYTHSSISRLHLSASVMLSTPSLHIPSAGHIVCQIDKNMSLTIKRPHGRSWHGLKTLPSRTTHPTPPRQAPWSQTVHHSTHGGSLQPTKG